jgi:hypothetical protein
MTTLDDYIREGYLGPATAALHTVRNRIADAAEMGKDEV